ncbi:hypothetical protein E2C01_004469 [Portunus trituberculatus]|uniref:Uncharacterized protein n=1 Tax=Portunus trituberculatus TaxID=210409 RepID=A0A5B7CT28_PORTR|nr:hypothetical protein [Portunus trituberculatus]
MTPGDELTRDELGSVRCLAYHASLSGSVRHEARYSRVLFLPQEGQAGRAGLGRAGLGLPGCSEVSRRGEVRVYCGQGASPWRGGNVG